MNKMTHSAIKYLLVGSLGFVCVLTSNFVAKYKYQDIATTIFSNSWWSEWFPYYLITIIIIMICILALIFGNTLDENNTRKNSKSSYFRLIIVLPLLLYGFSLIAFSIVDLGLDRVNSFIFGSVFCYSAYLVYLPLSGKYTIPTRWSNKILVRIAVGLCASVFLIPLLKYLLPYKPVIQFIVASYENGYALSLLTLALAIGMNLRLERGRDYKPIFIAFWASIAIISIGTIVSIIKVMSSLP